MSREGIPAPGEFKASTSPDKSKFAVKRVFVGRGADMTLIDAAIAEWDVAQSGNDASRKVLALRHIIKTCSLYLKNRIGKKTNLCSKRKGQIRRVLDLALAALKKFDAAEGSFASNKSKGVIHGRFDGKTTSLAGAYKHERTSYESTGKTYAAAATILSDMDGFGASTYQQYVGEYEKQLRDAGGSQGARDLMSVAYLAKNDRMAYLAIAHDGVFKRPDGTDIYSAGVDMSGARSGDMWAMDRYGNFFVKAAGAIRGKGAYFNHSSFCAGTDVVCAGVCMFNKGGVLVYLDNNSGHYKPDAEAVRSALAFLSDEGVNISLVRVGLATGNDSINSYLARTVLSTRGITSARTEDWPVNYNAPLKLPGVVMA